MSGSTRHSEALAEGRIAEQRGELERAAEAWAFAADADDPAVAVAAVVSYGRLISEQQFVPGVFVGSHVLAKTIRGHAVADADRLWRLAAESGHPDAAWGWVGLGRLYDPGELPELPDATTALAAFERAASSGHRDAGPCGLFQLGRLQAKLGREERGAEGGRDGDDAFERGANEGHPLWSPHCAWMLAESRAAERDFVAARRWWELAAAQRAHPIAELAAKALDDLDAQGADPFAGVDARHSLGVDGPDAVSAFDAAVAELRWDAGLVDVGRYSHVRRESGPHHLYAVPRKRLLSGRGGRIKVLVKQLDGEEGTVALRGGTPKDRDVLLAAMLRAMYRRR